MTCYLKKVLIINDDGTQELKMKKCRVEASKTIKTCTTNLKMRMMQAKQLEMVLQNQRISAQISNSIVYKYSV
jgi:hypothetical protein